LAEKNAPFLIDQKSRKNRSNPRDCATFAKKEDLKKDQLFSKLPAPEIKSDRYLAKCQQKPKKLNQNAKYLSLFAQKAIPTFWPKMKS